MFFFAAEMESGTATATAITAVEMAAMTGIKIFFLLEGAIGVFSLSRWYFFRIGFNLEWKEAS